MRYIKSTLLMNEDIVQIAEITWFTYINSLIYICICFILFSSGHNNIAVLLLCYSIFVFIKAFIYKHTTEVAITNKKIVFKTGLIKRDTLELNLDKIESFSIKQSIIGRLFDYGDIYITGTGGTTPPIRDIDSPVFFRNQAQKTVDKIKSNLQ